MNRTIVVLALLAPTAVLASAGADAAHNATLLFWIAVILLAARFGSLVERLGQPAVLGELLAGIVLGNLGLAGIHLALASQLYTLAERVGLEQDCAMIGGGAKDIGLVKAMKEISGHDFIVPDEPQMMAALGAAIIAGENIL